MPTATTRPALQLDSAELEKLLTALHGGGEAVAGTVQLRLRYLQRSGFPNDRAGRGKRATYDLADIVRVMLAFELLNLDLSPQRAIASIQQSWTGLARSVVPAWVALRMVQRDGATDEGVDHLRRVAIIRPSALAGDAGGLVAGLLRPSTVNEAIGGHGGELRHAIMVDLLGVVKAVDVGLQGDGFGFTPGEVDAAFERFGEHTFGNAYMSEWRPPADE